MVQEEKKSCWVKSSMIKIFSTPFSLISENATAQNLFFFVFLITF